MPILNSLIIGGGGGETYPVKVLAVGGGGAGGVSNYGGGAGGGGGGGQVICTDYNITEAANIIVGVGGKSNTNRIGKGLDGGETSIYGGDGLIAKGGCGGGGGNSCYGGAGGNSGSGCIGGCSGSTMSGGGGGGAGGCGGVATEARGGNGGVGLYGYGGGGAGRGTTYNGCSYDGGGASQSNATNYGGGGGGGRTSGYGVGSGCGGMVEVCYKSDGSCGFKRGCGGDCCYTCNGYNVHRFTNSGVFQILCPYDYGCIMSIAGNESCPWSNTTRELNTDGVAYYNKFLCEGHLGCGRNKDYGGCNPTLSGVVQDSDVRRVFCIGYCDGCWSLGRYF